MEPDIRFSKNFCNLNYKHTKSSECGWQQGEKTRFLTMAGTPEATTTIAA